MQRKTPLKRAWIRRKPVDTDLAMADQLWREAIHRQKRCQRCKACLKGSPFPLEAHHLISRSHKSTRHKRQNGLLLCRECHRFAHAMPDAFNEWLSKAYPDRWEWVQKHKHDIGRPDYKAAAAELMRGVVVT